ncbi:S8 family serine peptidase [Mycoplasma sp. 1654_15]|uniref:S8 family serine peptidase n=1 Tax=Mycoplasma sp. 1654_15 TaxID=2725994 RepID=UPI00144A0092|nr:S8 family serine peptidase [Mycoplasma sp. 1654_15]QJB71027.1 S8 family serine peptidase [Mycoplasma sp. 1654_15]
MKKLKKFILPIAISILSGLAIFSFSSITYSNDFNNYTNNDNVSLTKNNSLASANFSGNKYITNIWKVPKILNSESNSDIKVKDELEIKLYLDVSQEKGTFAEKVQNLSNKIKLLVKNDKAKSSIKTSQVLPIIWVNFDEVKEAEDFINESNKLEFVKKIIFFKKEYSESKIYFPTEDFANFELPNRSGSSGGSSSSSSSSGSSSKSSSNGIIQSDKDIYSQYTSFDNKKIFNDINLKSYRIKELENNWNMSKVGVLEARNLFLGGQSRFRHTPITKYNDYPDKGSRRNKPRYQHGTEVSHILAGKTGINNNAKIFYSSFLHTNSEWQKSIEWMVIDNGVRVINHSYGSSNGFEVEYNDSSYFIDYISRKYGVLNIFAAGNGNDDEIPNGKWIDDTQLAYNAISVGATKTRKNINDDFTIAPYSNRTLESHHTGLPKPLVVAPGTFKNTILNEEINGTSLAAPTVTGAISNIFRQFSYLDNDAYRVPSATVILAASAHLPKNEHLERKSNGLNSTYGAGLIDYEKMIEAARNITTLSTDDSANNSIIFTSQEFNLKQDDNIQIVLSWMFNAGILSKKENEPEAEKVCWWEWFIPWKAHNRQKELDEKHVEELKKWNNTHINNQRLKLNEAKQRQNQALFSDYDLILEKQNNNGDWETQLCSTSIHSNVELINFKVWNSGKYRFKVKKYKSALFKNSVDDRIAVTYTLNKK